MDISLEPVVSNAAESSKSSKQRLVFIDVLRGIACVWMIETHVVNASLAWTARYNWFFQTLEAMNGYVSVTFIFCAGAGFWLAATRKVQEYKTFQPAFWQYVRRLGFILLVAYWLHIPEISLQKFLIATPMRQNILWTCDVLHAIVMASFIALGCLLVVPRLQQLRWVFVGLMLLFLYLTPFVWRLEPDTFLPRVLGAYLSHPPAATFPPFPWCAYFFAGAALTAFFLEARDRRAFAWRCAVIGFVLPFVVITFRSAGWNHWFIYAWTETWYPVSPGNFMFRVGGTMVLFSLLYLFQEPLSNWTVMGRKPMAWLQLLGQESLFVYVFHLMLVYGSPVNLGMSYFMNGIVPPFALTLIIIALIVAVYVLTEQWRKLKLATPEVPRRILWAFGVLFVLVFLLVPARLADNAELWMGQQLERVHTALGLQ
jgi:uncharacterized membrane protein